MKSRCRTILGRNNIKTPAVEYDKAIKGGSFMAGNCASNNNREKVVRELTDMLRVDSIGKCLHDVEPPNNVPQNNKGLIQKQYLFHLAFENTDEDDYITKKLWGTLSSGTLAIYKGSPNAKDHAPPNSIISWHDFGSNKELGEYIIKVMNNKTLYDSYHEWRKKPLPESFHNKYNFTNTHSICCMCRWGYAKKMGLGWDHDSQTIQETRLPQKLCLAI